MKAIRISLGLTFIFILFFTGINVFAGKSYDKIGRPVPGKYLNPYELMKLPKIDYYSDQLWMVVCNRDYAPIYKKQGDDTPFQHANYLEIFQVKKRDKNLVFVQSENRNVKGWMDMKHLILKNKAGIDPYTSVYHKVFLRVRLEKKTGDEQGLNSLRFRKGPGTGKESHSKNNSNTQFDFLTKKQEVAQVGSLFFYVYGVHFNDEKEDYQDASKFKDADYFLVGQKASFTLNDIKKDVISGWIPRQSAILWDTRQALEKIANRSKEDWDAHKFKSRKLSNIYFNRGNDEEKQNFLRKYSSKIVRDNGEGPPESGQTLRNVVLGTKHEYNGVVSEYIGFTGRSYQNTMPLNGSEKQQDILAILHESIRNVEIFFLVDATLSMGPCLKTVAKVSQEIKNELEGKDINAVFHGAVYRDESDKTARYQEWDPDKTPSISDWFDNIKAFSEKDDDYPEDLFNAIIQAIENWSDRYVHRLSVRIMVILGDAGNRDNSIKKKEVVRNIEKNMIIPFAIHFEHPCRSEKKEKCDSEKEAMQKFIDQLNEIANEEVQSIPGDKLFCNINQYIVSIINTLDKIMKDMSAIRLGQKSFCESLCEIGYDSCPNLIQGCKKSCVSEEKFKQYISKYQCTPKATSAKKTSGNLGIFLTYLDYMKKTDPELYKFLMNRPKMAFSEGFMAVEKNEKDITRPVLLLGRYELGKIEDSIEDLTTMYRNCEDSQNHDFIRDALSTILGELLQTDPEVIRLKQLEGWFGKASELLVGSERSFLGVEELMSKMCENREKLWVPFLGKLEEARDKINQIKHERNSSRTYLDLTKYPYYWIYPEEIFPRPTGNN